MCEDVWDTRHGKQRAFAFAFALFALVLLLGAVLHRRMHFLLHSLVHIWFISSQHALALSRSFNTTDAPPPLPLLVPPLSSGLPPGQNGQHASLVLRFSAAAPAFRRLLRSRCSFLSLAFPPVCSTGSVSFSSYYRSIIASPRLFCLLLSSLLPPFNSHTCALSWPRPALNLSLPPRSVIISRPPSPWCPAGSSCHSLSPRCRY